MREQAKKLGVRVQFSSILTFSVLFPWSYPKGPPQEKYLEIYDREHLFLRPDSESLTNLQSWRHIYLLPLIITPYMSAGYHPYIYPLVTTLYIYTYGYGVVNSGPLGIPY